MEHFVPVSGQFFGLKGFCFVIKGVIGDDVVGGHGTIEAGFFGESGLEVV